jgi:hypothetical protein
MLWNIWEGIGLGWIFWQDLKQRYHKLSVFENKVPRIISGPSEEEHGIIHSEVLFKWHLLMGWLNSWGWDGWDMKNTWGHEKYIKISICKGRGHLGAQSAGRDWIHLAQDRFGELLWTRLWAFGLNKRSTTVDLLINTLQHGANSSEEISDDSWYR